MQFGFEICPYCGFQEGFVYVHGHYQCKRCHQNVMPCCGGEQEITDTQNEQKDTQTSFDE